MVSRRWVVVLVGAGALVALAILGPLAGVLAASRVTAMAVLVTGAWVLVGRTGLVDLATGAATAAGAYAGGVLAAVLALPSLLGLVSGALAGAVVAAASAATAARVGRLVGALTSLALAGGIVALLGAWPAGGGAAGYHAVPLLTGSDRGDLLVSLLALLVALSSAAAAGRSRAAARAALAVHAPPVARAVGRPPVRDAVRAGVAGGALLGGGGALQAALSGSVAPGAYGLSLAAALALAVLVGGAPPLGPPVGALLVSGPAIAFPLVPVVGDAPPLLVTGILGIVLLGLRRGRPLVPSYPDRAPAAEPAPPRPAVSPRRLQLRSAGLADGWIDLEVAPGEVVALVGPNGAGKSTLLARIAGQVPDAATVLLGDLPAPAGPVARAGAGVARTWQHPADLPAADLLRVSSGDLDGAATARWAALQLGDAASTPAGRDLVALAGRRPAVALLDEPGAALPVRAVAAIVRGLADGGAAVLLTEHRHDLVAHADRVVGLSPGAGP